MSHQIARDLSVGGVKSLQLGLSLKILGTGLGGKAIFELAVTRDFNDCRVCQAIYQNVEVRVRRYKGTGLTNVQVIEETLDPVKWLDQEPEDSPECCIISAEQIDRFRYQPLSDHRVDARRSSAILKDSREISFHQEGSAGADIGLSVELSRAF